ARAVQTAVQAFPDTLFATVTLDTLVTAAGVGFANNGLLIQASGVYQISGEILWASNGVGPRFLSLFTTSTGETAAASRLPVSGIETVQSASTLVRLVAGDIVSLSAGQNSGASLNSSVYQGRAAALTAAWIAP